MSALVSAPMRTGVCDVRISQLESPLGLEDAQPTFSWRIELERPGAGQGSFRIVVARSACAASAGRGELWDSGIIASDASSGVQYAGAPLSSRQRCFCAVEAWDEAGEFIGSSMAQWEMGLLDPNDWSGAWLAVEDEAERDDRLAGLPFVTAPAPLRGRTRRFRLQFEAMAAAACEAVIAVQGQLKSLNLDGAALTIPPRHPNAWGGEPSLRLSRALSRGPHVLEVEVAAEEGPLARSEVAVAALLRLTLANDGRTERVTGDWRTSDQDLDRPDHWTLAAPSANGGGSPWPPTPARLLRRGFDAGGDIASVRLYVAALGAFEAYLNGRRVSDEKLSGESVDFSKRVFYRVYDVTHLVMQGENVLGLIVGDGWFASYQAPHNRFAFCDGPRRVIAQLEIEYSHGARQTVATDESWRSAQAPVLASEIYDGEIYDARLEQPGWAEPNFDDSAWRPVWRAPTPSARLVALSSPPVREQLTLPPCAIERTDTGAFVVDFGQNFAGWVRLRVRGAKDDVIVIRFAELLGPDGRIDQRNLRGAMARDIYIANGRDEALFEPHFTYHGFRYAEVEGLERLSETQIEGVVLHSDLAETGEFACDSRLLSQVWCNALWSQRSNFVGIPTDCPQRDERLGWSGDAAAFWDAASYNMDVYAFTRRYMNDLRDAQKPNGAFPLWAPMDRSTAHSPLTATPTPGWADAGVTLPWVCAHRTGDMTIVNENWGAMHRFVSGVLDRNGDYVWRNGRGIDFGDWLSVDAASPQDATTPKDLLASALLVQALDRMSDMAAWSGHEREHESYNVHATRAREAFGDFVSAGGVVGNASHTSYALALALRLAPPGLEALVAANFAAAIRARGTLLTCGFIGTPLALDAVAQAGDAALVYDLLLREDYPSWGYMAARGATTMWERWNSDAGDVSMNSHNHYAFGAVVAFFYRRIAGIEAETPGFAKLSMRPLADPRVRHARAAYQSIRGQIEAEWRFEGDDFVYEISLPANVCARIELPYSQGAETFDVSSGRHRFKVRAH